MRGKYGRWHSRKVRSSFSVRSESLISPGESSPDDRSDDPGVGMGSVVGSRFELVRFRSKDTISLSFSSSAEFFEVVVRFLPLVRTVVDGIQSFLSR